jgi:cupin 2 domain-containing protein
MPTDGNPDRRGNIFSSALVNHPQEVIEIILRTESFWLERIISTGQATLPGQWLDQETAEWVILLSGGARLCLENEFQEIIMKPGDYLHIPAHRRHRVEWTDPGQLTIWLALHHRGEKSLQ